MNHHAASPVRTMSRRQALCWSLAGAGAVALSGCREATNGPPSLRQLPSLIRSSVLGPDLPGKIAFVKGTEIWQWTNGTSRPLATGQAFADPAWSPDGTHLAAIVMGTNQSDLVILNAAGAVVRRLTTDLSTVSVQDSVWARKPAWSPDGKRLAFITDRGKHDMSLWLISPAGGPAQPLIVEQPYSGGLDWPTWSPSGMEIAYTTFIPGVSQIHAYNLETHEARIVARDPGGDLDPAWSPTGTDLAYVGRDGQSDDVFVGSVDATERVKVTQGGVNRAPAWSPTGSALGYLAGNGDTFDLFVAQIAGSAASTTRLTSGINIVAQAGITWTS